MEQEAPETTLRDMLAANLDAAETVVSDPPLDPPAPVQETPEQKAGRTANRLRDDQGRLLPGTKEAAPAASPVPPPTSQEPTQPVAAPVTRPSSWKKDHWEAFDKLAAQDPKLADYINQREREFATGVSAYKNEAEQARALNEAIAPFVPNLQRFGIQPKDAVQQLLTAHERLSLGSPQEKVALGVKLIRDYGIDAQALFQVMSGQQPQYQPQQQQPQPQVDIEALVAKAVDQRAMASKVESAYTEFVSAKDDTGALKYPHYEAVKATMAGLLQADLAQDYPSAYQAAIRMPQHAEIWDGIQQQEAQAKEQQRLAASQAQVNRARSNAVSPRTATPGAAVAATVNGKTSLRDQIASNLEAVESGRV